MVVVIGWHSLFNLIGLMFMFELCADETLNPAEYLDTQSFGETMTPTG